MIQPVRADFVQIERVLANLMENATRYSDGEPVIIRARPVGDRAIVRVIDRGPGIRAADQERIFEPFYRLDARRHGDAAPRLGTRPGDRQGVRRGQRRPDLGRVQHPAAGARSSSSYRPMRDAGDGRLGSIRTSDPGRR